MQHLIREFRDLYEEKLRRLDVDTSGTQEEKLQMKVYALQSYVSELAELNRVLVETIEDLEKETSHKVSNPGLKHSTSDCIIHDLSDQSRALEQSVCALSVYSENTDLNTLAQLTRPAGCACDLDLSEVELRTLCQDQTVGQCPRSTDTDPLEGLKPQQSTHDLTISPPHHLTQQSTHNLTISGLRRTLDRKSQETKELERGGEQAEEHERESSEYNEHVRHLEKDAGSQRSSQESMKKTLAMKEKHCQQLSQDNSQLRDSLAALQNKLRTAEGTASDITDSLNHECQQRQQILNQLHCANQEVGRLRQEMAHVCLTAEKKIQRREVKLCALVKELREMKKQHSDCHRELLDRQTASEKLQQETDVLRAKMEEHVQEYLSLTQTKERLENDLALSHEKYQTTRLEVRSRDQLIIQLKAEMKTSHQKLDESQEELSYLQTEVRRLNEEVTGHQEDIRLLRSDVQEQQEVREQEEKERQQLQHQLCGSQQQVKSQAESISRLTSDLVAVKTAHKVNAQHWSQRKLQLRSHSEQARSKLRERESEVTKLKERLNWAEVSQREAAQKVEACETLLKTRDGEVEILLKTSEVEREEATERAQRHQGSAALFKQKYAVAMEKVQRMRMQVESLEEELRYSQQQRKESHGATNTVKAELVALEGRYQEKVSQWENSQEALDQLTDELRANQNLLRDCQDKVGQCEGLITALENQVEELKQQCCSQQVQHLAESERSVLQMKTKLERQAQEKANLECGLVASHHTHLTTCSQLEQEVACLEQEVKRLKVELADSYRNSAQKEQRSEEELRTARREADRGEAEVRRLQTALRRERSDAKENHSLRERVSQLSQELEALRSKHRLAVKELSILAEEEVRRMEHRQGKQGEERRRSEVEKLQRELADVSEALQQALGLRLQAQREKQEAWEQVDMLHRELEGSRSDNSNLRHESQLVMANVNHWISKQKAANESLAAQMKSQNKVVVVITEEKERLQEANDTLQQELKRLKNLAQERDAEMERLKAQIHKWDSQQEDDTRQRTTCVALNLSRIKDMQTRLQSNLEAIRMLNQQLRVLGGENEQLRRKLQEETAARRRAQLLLSLPPPPPPPPASLFFPATQPLSSAFPLTSPPSSSPPFLNCRRRTTDPEPELEPDPARPLGTFHPALTRAELGRGPDPRSALLPGPQSCGPTGGRGRDLSE